MRLVGMTAAKTVRQRVPYLGLGVILLVALSTIGGAAANMIPSHIPTEAELRSEEEAEIFETRRARVTVLISEGDHCRAEVAREIARGLVYDGRTAHAKSYANDYERRCGEDPVVRSWAEATLPKPR